MIYKVYYQESLTEVPVREKTKTVYVKAESVREARQILKDRKYNIEYVGLVDEAYLAYEQQNEDFIVLEQ
ncbi:MULTISPECIES: DNA-dependent RNA polymerase subunit epsilon [Bacillus]|uniref:DNA-dependent RNA polymerase subunit epsilon n=1 Tax=Bacillus TaxID=1386 RepID=UPI0002D95C21|nr:MULTISPECIES: RNA polymerase epsilon subunit [Bacillus]